MKKYLFPSLFLSLSISLSVQADTIRYVSDQLYSPLRTGSTTGHKIIKMLKSGRQVSVIETDPSGWAHIKSGKIDGWILSRYLMTQPASREQLKNMEKKLLAQEIQIKTLQQENATGLERNKTILSNIQQTKEKNGLLTRNLNRIQQTAASALTMEKDNRDLKIQVKTLQGNLQAIQLENDALSDRTARDWFMIGAAVLILGLILGLIIPRIRWRKKADWNTF